MSIDLTPFGFTPTESLVYSILLEHGPGTGYAIARAANVARANAYSALEGLLTKGAASAEDGRPKRYQAESPGALIARLSSRQTKALDRLAIELERLAPPDSPTLVEIHSARGAVRLISHDVERARTSVELVAPADAYPLLTAVLGRAHGQKVALSLWSVGETKVSFAEVRLVPRGYRWPGMPLVAVVDDERAVIAARQGSQVEGHWSAAPTFVAAARLSIERLGGHVS